MEYRLPYKISARDYWEMVMRSIYQSFAGIVNVIFIVSMLLVTYALWNQAGTALRLVLLLFTSLFTVIQPLGIYIRSKRLVNKIPKDTEIRINDNGIRIESSNGVSEHAWKNVKKIILSKSMCVVSTGNNNGVILSYENMGSKKEEILRFIQECAAT